MKPPDQISQGDRRQNLVTLIQNTALSAAFSVSEDDPIVDTTFKAIHDGLLDQTLPSPENLKDVVTAFETAASIVFSNLSGTRSEFLIMFPEKAMSAFRTVAFFVISAYSKGEGENSGTKIEKRVFEICSELEENLRLGKGKVKRL